MKTICLRFEPTLNLTLTKNEFDQKFDQLIDFIEEIENAIQDLIMN